MSWPMLGDSRCIQVWLFATRRCTHFPPPHIGSEIGSFLLQFAWASRRRYLGKPVLNPAKEINRNLCWQLHSEILANWSLTEGFPKSRSFLLYSACWVGGKHTTSCACGCYQQRENHLNIWSAATEALIIEWFY